MVCAVARDVGFDCFVDSNIRDNWKFALTSWASIHPKTEE